MSMFCEICIFRSILTAFKNIFKNLDLPTNFIFWNDCPGHRLPPCQNLSGFDKLALPGKPFSDARWHCFYTKIGKKGPKSAIMDFKITFFWNSPHASQLCYHLAKFYQLWIRICKVLAQNVPLGSDFWAKNAPFGPISAIMDSKIFHSTRIQVPVHLIHRLSP